MTAIVAIHAREIPDSRGNPTVEVDLVLEDGSLGRAVGARRRPARGLSRRNTWPISPRAIRSFSIEDGMAEDDMEGWKELTGLIGGKCQLVGDDLKS